MKLNPFEIENLEWLDEAAEEYSYLDGSVKAIVLKAIIKVLKNPEPSSGGGYGKPLGNLSSSKLSGYNKIKIKSAGLRIVYKYIQTNNGMRIIIISAREDDYVYKQAEKRIAKYRGDE